MKDRWADYFRPADEGVAWHEELTPAQWALVRALARAEGKALTAQELGEELYGDVHASRALYSLMRRTRDKMKIHGSPFRIINAGQGRGWKLQLKEGDSADSNEMAV